MSWTATMILLACAGDDENTASPVPAAEQTDRAHGAEVGHHDASEGHDAGHAAEVASERWTCPMHPEVQSSSAGSCPTCGMDLVLAADTSESSAGGHMQHMAEVKASLQAALGDAYDAAVPGLEAADPTRGKASYDAICGTCHGTGGQGDGPGAASLASPPADFTDAAHSAYYSDAGRLHILQNGVPGTPMAGFGASLDAAAQLDLYAYVKSLRAPPSGDGHDHGAHGHP